MSVDSTYVKNVRGQNCLGRNPSDRGRNATKFSVITDKNGLPISFYFAPGNEHDLKAVPKLINNLIIKPNTSKSLKYPVYFLGDRGYDSKALREYLKQNKYIPVIPYRSYRGKKKHLAKRYKPIIKLRYKVEAYFGWIDQYRRLILRYDSLISSYKSFTFLASSLIIIRKNGLND